MSKYIQNKCIHVDITFEAIGSPTYLFITNAFFLYVLNFLS